MERIGRCMRLIIRVGLGLALTAGLLSCGGGGSGAGGTTSALLRFTVNWAERSRALSGPGSALSVVVRVTGGGVASGDFIYSANRDANTAAHPQTYLTGVACRVGAFPVTATFYANTNATGDVVGVASGQMTVGSDGTLIGSINTVGTIASVVVTPGQSVAVSQTFQLDFSARDGVGGVIAVSPGSALWNVVSGADKISFENGYAVGLAVGSATVTATVDGRTSATATVNVTTNPQISVSIAPQAVVVLPGASQQFTATVSGTANTAVTWSVLTSGGGSISGSGFYTAPGTIMYATVEARSVADPSKAATALVTVQSGTLTLTVRPSSAYVAPNGTRQFSGVVDGSPNQGVVWAVQETGGGSISGTGVYAAPAAEGEYTVLARSVADPSVSGTGTAVVGTGVVKLHPSEGSGSWSFGVEAGQQVGYVQIAGIQHASLWDGSSMWIDLNPAGAASSVIWSVDSGNQVGHVAVGSAFRASLWSGTAASWVDLSPASSSESYAYGVSGSMQVGAANVGGATHAGLWTGTASSWVDLNPAGGSESNAFGTDGDRQVGWARVGSVNRASLWDDSAASWIDLNPLWSLESEARGTAGGQQVGWADISPLGAGLYHASLWTGSAASWVDLHPAGATYSRAYAVHAGRQVGWALVNGEHHACMWSGSAGTWVDLHTTLPASFTASEARGVYISGSRVFVAGGGVNSATGRNEAILWVLPL